jgi:hypothetical protein
VVLFQENTLGLGLGLGLGLYTGAQTKNDSMRVSPCKGSQLRGAYQDLSYFDLWVTSSDDFRFFSLTEHISRNITDNNYVIC